MPRVPAKKYYKRKRRNYRRKRTPLSRGQVRAVKSIALNQIQARRELKTLYNKIDGESIPLQNGARLIESTGGNQCYTLTATGDSAYQRNGLQINARYFNFVGHVKINGASGLLQNREVMVRVTWGFVKEPISVTQDNLMLNAGYEQPLSPDITCMYKPYNWNVFRPFSDQVFKLAPAHQYEDAGNVVVNTMTPVPDSKFLKASYKWGRKGKQIQYENNTLDYANQDNIVCLVITRNMNDNLTSSMLNLKMWGTTNFRYTDA